MARETAARTLLTADAILVHPAARERVRRARGEDVVPRLVVPVAELVEGVAT